MIKIITNSEQETFDFAKKYAKSLKGGEVIGLAGELGAGKTIFSKGIAAGLGVTKNVASPTFVVMKVYDTQNKKIKTFCHVDAYKISDTDVESIGIPEYLNDKNTVCIIEWIENISKALKSKVTSKIFLHTKNNQRIITQKK